MLWRECDETRPFTGRRISFSGLFVRGDFQIRHIIPLSRSLDGKMLNKTRCASDVYKREANQTPYEFPGKTPEWDNLTERMQAWAARAGRQERSCREQKLKNFLREDCPPGQEGIEGRQKADSSYLAVAARKFLARLGRRQVWQTPEFPQTAAFLFRRIFLLTNGTT